MRLVHFAQKNTLLKWSISAMLIVLSFTIKPVLADQYTIDNGGAHSTIQFKISHLGYAWLWGRFNDFEGDFSYYKNNPSASNIVVTVNSASVDTNHAELNKHLRGGDFLDVKNYPEIKFTGTKYTETTGGKGTLEGNLTLHGITKKIVVDVTHVGAGDDPWGGYRRGFEGVANIVLADYGIKKNLGPASAKLELHIALEGIKK